MIIDHASSSVLYFECLLSARNIILAEAVALLPASTKQGTERLLIV